MPDGVDLPELLRQYTAWKCRGSLAEFVRRSWHVLEPSTALAWNWHHEEICGHLQGMFLDWRRAQDDPSHAQRAQNIAINVPPGSLKSRIIAVCFPAWAWLHSPGWRVICLSVNHDAAKRDARASRQLIESEWYARTFAPDWRIKADQDAVGNYGNTAEGSRLSRAAGSEIVGLRGDCLIMDDPNNPNDAQSEKIRKEVNALWNTNTFNRVNSMRTSLRIIVQQRTHEEDLTGYVLQQKGARWAHLFLPAEFEPERACSTAFGGDRRSVPGESIHPELLPAEVLAAEKVRFGSYGYAGQMQQRPAPADGGMFRRSDFRIFGTAENPEPGKYEATSIFADLTQGGETGTSRVCFLVMSRAGAGRYVREVVVRPMTYPEQKRELVALHKRWPQAGIVLEDAACARPVMMDLQGTVPGIKLHKPQGSKIERARSIMPLVEARNVMLPAGAAWVDDYLHELSVFPRGAHDDQVDVTSMALDYMRGSRFWDAW